MKNKEKIKSKQAKVIKIFEKIIGRSIPIVGGIYSYTVGVAVKDSNVIGLGLYDCELTTLPDSIGNLETLQILHLNDNKLTKIPKSIGNLKSLTDLQLGRNFLSALPDSFGQLESLIRLRLNFIREMLSVK